MTAPAPQLYLVARLDSAAAAVADALSAALDAGPVACVRLEPAASLADADFLRASERLLAVCHAREVALVATVAPELAKRAGLDGVHFGPGAVRQVEARTLLGPDAIIGVGVGASRHHGMLAAERGADYVAFGPDSDNTAPEAEIPEAETPEAEAPEVEALDARGLEALGLAPRDAVSWWQTMIETPVVAEGRAGAMTPETARLYVGAADFIAAGDAVWRHGDGPEAGVRAFLSAFALGPPDPEGPAR